MRVIFAFGPALGLSGCVTDKEMQFRLAQQDDVKCQSYGAKPGTPAYVQCRTQLDAAKTQADATIAAAPVYVPPPPVVVMRP